MTIQRIALIALALLAFAAKNAAAVDYCVPTAAACPGGAGTVQAAPQMAFDNAENSADADRIFIDGGTYTAPTAAGFSYEPNSPLQVIGDGASGGNPTVLTAPTGATNVLRLDPAAGDSFISALKIEVPQDFAGTQGAFRTSMNARNVAVTSHPTQNNTYAAVTLEADTSFEDGTVITPLTPANYTGILLNAAGTAVRRTSIVSRVGISANSGAQDASVDSVAIDADATGIDVGGATVDLTNSFVKITGQSAALAAAAQPTSDGVINASNVTLIGDNSADVLGVYARSSFANRKGQINLDSSILSGFPNRARARIGDAGSGGAFINATNSMFNPSTNLESGPGTMVPAAGSLSPGANLDIALDPEFESPGSGDYSLQANSPALDKGNPAAPATPLDALGNPRVDDGDGNCTFIRDMGAYERPQPLGVDCPDPPADPGPGAGSGSGSGGGAAGGPGGTAGTGGGNVTPRDLVAPTLTKLGLPRSLKRSKGGTLALTLSEAAKVECRFTPRGAKKSAAKAVKLSWNAKAGVNKLKIGKRKIRTGRYIVTVTATDAAGNKSKVVSRRVSVR